MMGTYIGITIGPIVDTFMETSTPAALWFASSTFSDITRRTCLAVMEKWPDAKIYSPYFDMAEAKKGYPEDGVSRYHDRIILSLDETDAGKVRDELNGLVAGVKKGTAGMFPENFRQGGTEEFLDEYLQIHFVVLDGSEVSGNAVLAVSPYLDMLELMKSFPGSSSGNAFLNLFNVIRKDESSHSTNDYLRETGIFKAMSKEDNAFLKNHAFRKIKDIAYGRNDTSLKYSQYFAIVSADGDGMGKFLESITTDEVTVFSKACLEYDSEATRLIKDYGGMPIYAGGDDLLFLAPVSNGGRYVFDVCREINSLFRDKIRNATASDGTRTFLDNQNIPTVSFGIAMRYYKYPLYEAFGEARELLSNVKKGVNGAGKNSMAVSLQKHSGQSLLLYIGNDDESYGSFKDIFCMDNRNEKKVRSLLYGLDEFSTLYGMAIRKACDDMSRPGNNPEMAKKEFLNIWDNLSDNPNQRDAKKYVRGIAESLFDGFILKKPRITAEGMAASGDYPDSVGAILHAVMRLSKFYEEKAGDD